MIEEELVRYYCQRRPLKRPRTNIKTLLLFFLKLVEISLVVNIIIIKLIEQLCRNISFLQSCIALFLFLVLFCYRSFLTILVELYQHYAPERVRRRCICMPTCSEYAIICINKYNAFKALKMIYHRLTKECVGQIYHIDNP